MSSVAAGAQAGAAFGPWGAAIGGALGAVSDIGTAAAGGPFMGGDSHAAYGDTRSDGSGWTVNVGSGSAQTDASGSRNSTSNRADPQANGQAFAAGIGQPAGTFGGIHPVALLAAGGLVLAAFFLRR